MTAAQERMLAMLQRYSAREEASHPGSGGWVEYWEVADDWGRGMVLGFVPNAAMRTWAALERAGLVEDHPDPDMRGLVRPATLVRATP